MMHKTPNQPLTRRRLMQAGLSMGLGLTVAPLLAQPLFAQSESGFQAWVAAFRNRAIARGMPAQVVDRALTGLSLNRRVIELDRRQSEFTKQIWEYLDSAVSDTRVSTGRDRFYTHRDALRILESRYGVEAQIVTAIWGIETNYGGFMGGMNVIEALATLGYEGRRKRFAEEQLMAALKIIQARDIDPRDMSGSWAGAMGHTQFIPTSYLAYAQDFNGDGRRDVWNERDPMDALASSAHYLARHGWTMGQPWGVEITLPSRFDYSSAHSKNRRDARYWSARGVRMAGGGALGEFGAGWIYVPAGARGPAFLLYKNFDVIKRYNNANSYALAVGHLGDRIAGAGPFAASWPRSERALSRNERSEIQRRLTQKGFDTGGVDGIIGPNSISAIQAYQRANGLTADGHASEALLRHLRR